MSQELMPTKLPGYRIGPVPSEAARKLTSFLYDCHAGTTGMAGEQFKQVAERVGGIVSRPATDDGYAWLWAIAVDVAVDGETMSFIATFPWAQDSECKDGSSADRAIAIFVKELPLYNSILEACIQRLHNTFVEVAEEMLARRKGAETSAA